MTTWKELYDDLLQELALYQEEIKMTPQQGMRYLTRALSEFQRLTAIAEDTKVIITAGDLTSLDTTYPVGNDILEVVELLDSNGYIMLPVSYQQFTDIIERSKGGEIGFNETPAHYSRVRKRPVYNDYRWQLDEERGMTRIYTIFADQLLRAPSTGATLSAAIAANGTNQLVSGNMYRLTGATVALNAGTYVGNHTIVAPIPLPTNLGAVPIGTVIRVTTTFTPPNAAGVLWQQVTTSNDAYFTIRYRPHYDIYSSISPQWANWQNEANFELNFATQTPPTQISKFSPAFVSYAAGQYLRSQNVLSGQQPLWQQYDQEFRAYVEQAIMFKPVQSHELSSPYNISPYSN
jgi:hypothetical protein